MEVSEGAKSGDGTVVNVGIKMDGAFKCPHCRQTFSDDKALQLHTSVVERGQTIREGLQKIQIKCGIFHTYLG